MPSQIFDSHAHYDNDRFNEDREELLTALSAAGIKGVINAASDLASSHAGLALAERYDFIHCAVGVHPHEAEHAPGDYLDQLRELAGQPKVCAIGEIGLDYHYDFPPREVQRRVFEQQIKLALELDLPVIVHDREAHEDTMELLRRYRPKGVLHCFSGSAQMVREVVELGMYIGFTGVVTFGGTRRPLEAVAATPDDRLLIETDCPYMAPVPLRGKRCDSTMIPHTAAAMAAVKQMSTEQLLALTADNARRLFAIGQ